MVLHNPMLIYFTHSKINERFTGCSKLLSDTLNDILTKKISIDSIPKIKVFYTKKDGIIKYFSENNRRLWVFKSLYLLGFITSIDVRLVETTHKKYFTNTYSLEAKIIKI